MSGREKGKGRGARDKRGKREEQKRGADLVACPIVMITRLPDKTTAGDDTLNHHSNPALCCARASLITRTTHRYYNGVARVRLYSDRVATRCARLYTW